MEVSEKDWKLFRKLLPGWQTKYMQKLLAGYKELIEDGKDPAETFWELDKRINEDKKSPGVIVYNIRRSRFLNILISLKSDGVITDDDLKDFSEEIRNWLQNNPFF